MSIEKLLQGRFSICAHGTPFKALARFYLRAVLLLIFSTYTSQISALTFQQWQSVTSRAGSSPSDNWDGDLWSDLAEFALGSDPSSGLTVLAGTSTPAGLLITIENDGSIVPHVWLPLDREDIAVTLETSADLVNWADSGISPADTAHSSLILRAWTLASSQTGFARLRITLGTSVSTVTPPLGWSSVAITPSIQTLGVTLQPKTLYAGSAYDIVGESLVLQASESRNILANLPTDKELYVEFIEGHAEGHCVNVNLSQSTSTTLSLDLSHALNTTSTLPENIRGDRFVLRTRETLNEVFPKEWFNGGLSQTSSDRIERWNGTGWSTWWLLDLSPGSSIRRWVQGGDSTLASKDNTPLSNLEAFLVRRMQQPPILYQDVGEVRVSRRRYNLAGGATFVSGAYPFDASPVQLGFVVANGFVGTTNTTTASKFNIWSGDVTPGPSPSWTSYWLFGTSTPYWVKTGTFTSVNHSPLFIANRGMLFQNPSTTPLNSFLSPLPQGVASFELPANPLLDTDNDGLHDGWEIQMFGNLASNSLGDNDADGISNIDEMLLELNPFEPAYQNNDSTLGLLIYHK